MIYYDLYYNFYKIFHNAENCCLNIKNDKKYKSERNNNLNFEYLYFITEYLIKIIIFNYLFKFVENLNILYFLFTFSVYLLKKYKIKEILKNF